jgi:hypothetical protein
MVKLTASLITLVGLLVPLSGYAQTPHHTMTAGRPSAVLNHSRCTKVWNEAVPSGDTLAHADAGPYIVNWHQANPDNDNSMNKKEFFRACSLGLVKYKWH